MSVLMLIPRRMILAVRGEEVLLRGGFLIVLGLHESEHRSLSFERALISSGAVSFLFVSFRVSSVLSAFILDDLTT